MRVEGTGSLTLLLTQREKHTDFNKWVEVPVPSTPYTQSFQQVISPILKTNELISNKTILNLANKKTKILWQPIGYTDLSQKTNCIHCKFFKKLVNPNVL